MCLLPNLQFVHSTGKPIIHTDKMDDFFLVSTHLPTFDTWSCGVSPLLGKSEERCKSPPIAFKQNGYRFYGLHYIYSCCQELQEKTYCRYLCPLKTQTIIIKCDNFCAGVISCLHQLGSISQSIMSYSTL